MRNNRDRYTEEERSRQTNRQAETETEIYRGTNGQTETDFGRQTDRLTNPLRLKQTDRQTETERQTDRQTHRQTDRQSQRERQREHYYFLATVVIVLLAGVSGSLVDLQHNSLGVDLKQDSMRRKKKCEELTFDVKYSSVMGLVQTFW